MGLIQHLADWRARVALYWSCKAALNQGHMARVFMESVEYEPGTQEHAAWLMGIRGVLAIRITDDFKVQEVLPWTSPSSSPQS